MVQMEVNTLPAGKLAFLEAEFHAFSSRSDAASLTYVRPQSVIANHFEQPWPGAGSPNAGLLGEYSEYRELRFGESPCNRNQLLLMSVVLGHHFIWQRLSLFWLWPFNVTARSATLAVVPVCRESESTHFNSMYSSSHYGSTHHVLKKVSSSKHVVHCTSKIYELSRQ